MSSVAENPTALTRLGRIMGQNPLLPLILLLAGLIVMLEIMQPGIVNQRWLGNTVKFASPLAMLAACQTMTMLTGGLSGSIRQQTAVISALATARPACVIS